MRRSLARSLAYGFAAGIVLLGIYFGVLTLVSGWKFAADQFSDFWYFITALAAGFGLQVGIYTYLRELIKNGSQGVLGVTGTTSAAAMMSCCTHYLANFLPVLGTAGVVTFAVQYQTELFWVAFLFNAGGVAYMVSKIVKYKQHYEVS